MAHFSPVGSIHFAHPSAMPSLIPSTSSLSHKLRKSATSALISIRSKSSCNNETKSIKKNSISKPTLVHSSQDYQVDAHSRPLSTSSFESTTSSLQPFYHQSWMSCPSDDSILFQAQDAPSTSEKTAFVVRQIESFEEERRQAKVAEVVRKDALMDQELRRMGF
ncbi:BZ3500_MvSof-1268-A1-R1_Chr9g10498 [Microbotryum saponariae]|uniref:BZ3500_MvSof-1268-A1-R1_Chr9g10498 protein n=1 Tax=Microbotryum saponariae TaxID=289078 RepID=A0A2X0N4Q1_9BASI|nr:BZ3501_MvSof-1269-A2-R1_Chr9g10247 [Microbotryum saponariae]SDA00196.1 BZ3500_MvSof-1268-A1-R1_Chr9g10498 [Microbotryum saponariae]